MYDDETIEKVIDKVRILINDLNAKKPYRISIEREITGADSIMVKLMIAEDPTTISEVTKYFSDNSFNMIRVELPVIPGYYIVIKTEDIERILTGVKRKQMIDSVVNNPDCYILLIKFIALSILVYILVEIFKRQ